MLGGDGEQYRAARATVRARSPDRRESLARRQGGDTSLGLGADVVLLPRRPGRLHRLDRLSRRARSTSTAARSRRVAGDPPHEGRRPGPRHRGPRPLRPARCAVARPPTAVRASRSRVDERRLLGQLRPLDDGRRAAVLLLEPARQVRRVRPRCRPRRDDQDAQQLGSTVRRSRGPPACRRRRRRARRTAPRPARSAALPGGCCSARMRRPCSGTAPARPATATARPGCRPCS